MMIRFARPSRPGFTLIEMMVTLFIILVLISISIGALMKGVDWMNRSTTEQGMTRVYTALDKRIIAIRGEATGWDVPPAILTLAGNSPHRAKVIQRKFLIKWSFPQSYREAAYNVLESDSGASVFGYRSGGYPLANQIYRELRRQKTTATALPDPPTIATLPAVPATAAEAEAQNAACVAVLYNLLNSTDNLSSRELGDTNLDGVFEVIDGWGSPMSLYRWPTGLLVGPVNRLAGYASDPNVDQDDPENLLYDNAWQITTLASISYSWGVTGTLTIADEMEARFHPIRRAGSPDPRFAPLALVSRGSGRDGNPPNTPSILPPPDPMSAFVGPNGNPLNERARINTAVGGPEAEFDNLYSFRFRLGTRAQ